MQYDILYIYIYIYIKYIYCITVSEYGVYQCIIYFIDKISHTAEAWTEVYKLS
jgi:hypothetical protein